MGATRSACQGVADSGLGEVRAVWASNDHRMPDAKQSSDKES